MGKCLLLNVQDIPVLLAGEDRNERREKQGVGVRK
jgi:hypothetical protein